jgi:hypothetical protein
MAQQCQLSTSITGQTVVGGGATVDMAKSGSTVMAAVDERKQLSNRLQARVPSWSGRGALSHGVKTTRPCSVPRTTRARATAAQRTARPVALTPRQGKRHLWQAKRASFHLRDERVRQPPQSTRAPRPLLIRGSKAGPSEGFDSRPRGTLGHFRDQQERFCNGIPSEGGIEPLDPIEWVWVRQITCRYFWSAPLGH